MAFNRVVTIVLVLAMSGNVSGDEVIEDMTFRHVNWDYPAFYKWASGDIGNSAEAAVRSYCSEVDEELESPDFVSEFRSGISDVEDSKAIAWVVENYWLCAEESHAFLVAVGGTGETYNFGMICAEMGGLKLITYFSEIMLRRHKTCVDVDWDDEAEEHSIVVPGDK